MGVLYVVERYTAAFEGVVLKMLGLGDGEVLGFLNRVHQLRGTSGWPEAPWQREVALRTAV